MSLSASLAARLPGRLRRTLRSSALRAARVVYAGSGVVCPCCGSGFRRFAPFRGRPNEQCPRCGALARHRGVFLFLRDELRVQERPRRILHFAPEPSLRDWLSELPGEYVSADLDSPLADLRVDITALPLEDESFDLVLCSHVLEHVPDDRRAIAELHRVLSHSGHAVIQVPIRGETTFEDSTVTSPSDRARVFGQFDHVRIPGRDYGDRLRAGGFEVQERDPAEDMDEMLRARHGLRPGELFYYCRRS